MGAPDGGEEKLPAPGWGRLEANLFGGEGESWNGRAEPGRLEERRVGDELTEGFAISVEGSCGELVGLLGE